MPQSEEIMSYKTAIKKKCTDCIVDPLLKASALKQITACCAGNCPLYDHRPLITGLHRNDLDYPERWRKIVDQIER